MRGLTIFAPDFKPMRGGVAEYTYQLAHGLNKVNCLERLVTTVPQAQDSSYSFEVTGPGENYGRKLGERWGDSIPAIRKVNSFLYLGKNQFLRYRSALSLLRNRNAHVLFTWAPIEAAQTALSVCLNFGIKFSVVFHGYDLILLSEQNPSFLGEICARAEVLIFNSEATRNLFCRLCSSFPRRSYILHPGINPAQLDAASSIPAHILEQRFDIALREKTVFLSLARLVERKGIDIALRALAPLIDASEYCRYIIAGDGPEYNSLKAQVEARGLSDKIRLTGAVTDAEKHGLLEASSFFVMPNHTLGGEDFEGFGISFIEASYFENVVIGGRSGGAVEAIAEGKSGFLIDFEREGAEEQLRALAARLLDDPDRVDQLSKQGQQFVLEHFQAPDLAADFACYFDGLTRSVR